MLFLSLPNIRETMNILFKSEAFDHFLVSEVTIVNGATFNIDGHLTPQNASLDSSTNETTNPYISYGQIRNILLEIIKGKKTPSYMKFVLTLSPENIDKTLKSIDSPLEPKAVNGICLNITYQSGLLSLTNGISYTVFAKDISLEHEWDRLTQVFLKKIGIPFEQKT